MKLLIICGKVACFGSGHRVRMQQLEKLLQSGQTGGIEQQYLPIETDLECFADYESALRFAQIQKPATHELSVKTFVLLDMRDLDPLAFQHIGPVLALDNRHPSRRQLEHLKSRIKHYDASYTTEIAPAIYFHDTLPHPQSDLSAVLQNALIAPDLVSYRNEILKEDTLRMSNTTKSNTTNDSEFTIVCYAGNFKKLSYLNPIIETLYTKLNANEEANNSSKAPSQKCVLWIGDSLSKELSRKEYIHLAKEKIALADYWRYLSKAQYVLCYPGMTLLEAWFLGKTPLLIETESAEHNNLSLYLHEQAGLLYLNDGQTFYNEYDNQDEKHAMLKPSGAGYSILLEQIENIFMQYY